MRSGDKELTQVVAGGGIFPRAEVAQATVGEGPHHPRTSFVEPHIMQKAGFENRVFGDFGGMAWQVLGFLAGCHARPLKRNVGAAAPTWVFRHTSGR